MSANFYQLLKYAATGQASPDMTYYDRMRASTLMGGATVQTLTGIPPLSFKSDGTPLISWSMLGNGQQTGTPTPDNPVMPEFVGTLDSADWTIPITCAGQTVPVYLGTVQTVRRIKKLVLTGEESITSTHLDVGLFNIDLTGYLKTNNSITTVCTHYTAITNQNAWSGVTDKSVCVYGNPGVPTQLLYIRDSDYSTVDTFKQFLRDEYAAGHPVTIWYVLATPESTIINEPLAKIGNYADELHSTDAGVTIPTVKGQNVLTVDTDLQPSEMTITYKG